VSRIENAKSYPLGMNTGDLETALAAFAEDASYYGIEKRDGKIFRKLHTPKSAIREYIGAWLDAASGGITYKVRSAKEWGDCVLVEWEDDATGEGGHYVNEGILLFEFDERDEIVHARAYQDFGPLVEWPFLAEDRPG
jgi:ketosteroid isomerase-like protein